MNNNLFKKLFALLYLTDKTAVFINLIKYIIKSFIYLCSFFLWFIFLPITIYLHFFSEYRFVSIISQHIGHLTIQPYILLNIKKYDKKFKNYKFIILINKKISNNFLLKKWDVYFVIIRNSFVNFILKSISLIYFCNFNVKNFDSLHFKAQKIYDFNNQISFKKYLKLDTKEKKDFEILRRKIGVDKYKFFVCIQARNSHYYESDYLQTHRNHDIMKYQSAANYIKSIGGICVLIGSYKDEIKLKNVINYSQSAYVNPYNDILLCANNKFFLGSTSGLCFLSSVFNKRIVHTNMIPLTTFGLFKNDLSISKFLIKNNKILKFRNIVNIPIGNFFYSYQYKINSIKILDNDAEDILNAVKDMIFLQKYKKFKKSDELLIKSKMNLLNSNDYAYKSSAKIAPSFIKKHKSFFS